MMEVFPAPRKPVKTVIGIGICDEGEDGTELEGIVGRAGFYRERFDRWIYGVH